MPKLYIRGTRGTSRALVLTTAGYGGSAVADRRQRELSLFSSPCSAPESKSRARIFDWLDVARVTAPGDRLPSGLSQTEATREVGGST